MAFRSDLTVNGKTYVVLHASYSLHQSTDNTGRPASGVQGGQITVEVESTKDNALFDWMAKDDAIFDGKLNFYTRTNEKQILKTLEFKKGYVVAYTESFSAYGDTPMTEQFTISAMQITMGSSDHVNAWPENT